MHIATSAHLDGGFLELPGIWTVAVNKHSTPIVLQHFTARSSYASAVLGIVILSVCLSVRLSVIRVLCDETKEYTAKIFDTT